MSNKSSHVSSDNGIFLPSSDCESLVGLYQGGVDRLQLRALSPMNADITRKTEIMSKIQIKSEADSGFER